MTIEVEVAVFSAVATAVSAAFTAVAAISSWVSAKAAREAATQANRAGQSSLLLKFLDDFREKMGLASALVRELNEKYCDKDTGVFVPDQYWEALNEIDAVKKNKGVLSSEQETIQIFRGGYRIVKFYFLNAAKLLRAGSIGPEFVSAFVQNACVVFPVQLFFNCIQPYEKATSPKDDWYFKLLYNEVLKFPDDLKALSVLPETLLSWDQVEVNNLRIKAAEQKSP